MSINMNFTGQVAVISAWPRMGKSSAVKIINNWREEFSLVKVLDLDWKDYVDHFVGSEKDLYSSYCDILETKYELALKDHTDPRETVLIFVDGSREVREEMAAACGMDFYYIRPTRDHLSAADRALLADSSSVCNEEEVKKRIEDDLARYDNDFFCSQQTLIEVDCDASLIWYLNHHLSYTNEESYKFYKALEDKAKQYIRLGSFGDFALDTDGRIVARTGVLAREELEELVSAFPDPDDRCTKAFSGVDYVAVPKEAVMGLTGKVSSEILKKAVAEAEDTRENEEEEEFPEGVTMDSIYRELFGDVYSNYLTISHAMTGYIDRIHDPSEDEE